MARFTALVSFILFTVLALAGPLEVPAVKRSIQHSPLKAVEARAPRIAETTVSEILTKTHTTYVTTVVAATKTVEGKHEKKIKATETITMPASTTTVIVPQYGTTITETTIETETCYETTTVTLQEYGCTTTTVSPTVSVQPRAVAHKRAQGNQALYAREFA